jgi:hypothetical protein
MVRSFVGWEVVTATVTVGQARTPTVALPAPDSATLTVTLRRYRTPLGARP